MALLSLIEVSKQFDHKMILNRISLSIENSERVAIIGKNGSGKSSLVKILLGVLDFDEGKRVARNDLKIVSLEQKSYFDPLKHVYEVCEESLDDLRYAHLRLKEIEKILSTRQDKALLEEQAECIDFITRQNAWNLEEKIKEMLERFDLYDFRDRYANTLSGGEQKKLALATILVKKADLFILDEPTNHLDVESVEFLEEQILRLQGSVVFISHDRYFIDTLAHRILEVDNGGLQNFSGGYQKYLQTKEQILHQLTQEHENLLKLLKNEEEWLQKGVQARRKRNEGRKARVMELRKQARSNPSLIRKMQLELQREQGVLKENQPKNNKKLLFELDGVCKSVENKILIKDFSFRILQNEKIAIVGKNGSGKSTLLKILLGEKQDKGSIKRGEISIGYFDQQKTFLDDNKTLLETFCPNGGDHVEVYGKNIHVYGYLKNFLFPKELLDQKIGNLSGGEKNRVGLALLFTKKYDCLILDEPTNDLDIQTINILEEYLQNFQGSIIFVSHDRYFVDKIAHKLLVFQGNGVIEESYFSYSEFLENQKELLEYQKISDELANEEVKKILENEQKKEKKQGKLSYMEQRELEELPLIIDALEKEIKKNERELSDSNVYAEKEVVKIAEELQEKRGILEEKLERYFFLEEKRQKLI
ncbi:ABC-F family ATP-binding cassette domain-containing protein [Helicobacter sp. faydin-H20]|uniref:ribosomal protection-like ABC-F family protein n=1 Tax=Helicobacter anatolicus TaxID=2905874 RepID=UPI001E5F3D66|nr:ABC-F family ATP-binding cassette domain-containing protein [Helicobacter anatolicus]MCE3036344.1 ABC-F family ATP-binding cassette domain-containing protein [Helicobacter anatolicus]